MAYIWTDYSPAKTYRISTTGVSPYLEVWDARGDEVPVNLFYRLFPLLLPMEAFPDEASLRRQLRLYSGETAEDGERGRYPDIANLLLHWLAQLDRLRGMRLEEAVDGLLEEEILCGAYGGEAADTFRAAFGDGEPDGRSRRAFLRCLTESLLGAQRETAFDVALYALFPDTRLYYERSTDTVHIYLGEARSEKADARYRLCDFFFRDLLLRVQVMWKGEHFGVVGWDCTMAADQTALI